MTVAVTIDVDWAPDFMTEFLARELIRRKVRATWFVTHESPALEMLRAQSELFELGIHPNFLPGSTQGDTPEAILDFCMNLAPGATCIRMHALVQSSALFKLIATRTSVRIDLSILLPRAKHLAPVPSTYGLVRVPYLWEDDTEMAMPDPIWKLDRILSLGEGDKIFDFHPVFVYCNFVDVGKYQAAKPDIFAARCREDVAHFVREGAGPRRMFQEVLAHLAGRRSYRVCDLMEEWRLSRSSGGEGQG